MILLKLLIADVRLAVEFLRFGVGDMEEICSSRAREQKDALKKMMANSSV